MADVETGFPREAAETFLRCKRDGFHLDFSAIAESCYGLCFVMQEVASVADVEAGFPREVAETFLRCKRDGFDQTNLVVELNGLKIAEDRTFADCARYIFTTILGAVFAGFWYRAIPCRCTAAFMPTAAVSGIMSPSSVSCIVSHTSFERM